MDYILSIMDSTINVDGKSVNSLGTVEVGNESAATTVFKSTVETKVEKLPLTVNDIQRDAMGLASIVAGLESSAGTPLEFTDIRRQIKSSVVKRDAFNVGGYQDEVGIESFDGKDISAVVRYSIAGAYKNAYIDDASELVFPTLVIDPRLNGFIVDIEVLEIKKAFDRYVGNTKAVTASRTSLIKVVNDLKALGNNDNLLIPVIVTDSTSKDYNEELYNKDLMYTVTKRDEVVQTAPLLFGKKFAFLDISQTEKERANGNTSDREELGTVAVRELHVGIDPADPSKCLPIDLSGFNHQFTPSFDGDEKSVGLGMSDMIFTFNTSTTEMSVTGEPANTGGNIFDGSPANLTVGVKITFHASGNLRDGTFIFSAVKPEVVFVRTSAQVELDLTTGDGKDIVDKFALSYLDSVELSASTTNSTVRNKGVRGTVTSYSKAFLVPYRESDVIEHPVVNEYDKLTDKKRHEFTRSLNAKINMATIRSRQDGIVTLMSFFDSASNLSAVVSGNTANFISIMPSSAFVDPLIIDTTIDLISALDSARTGEKISDIEGVFALRVTNIVDELITATNYDIAHGIMNPSEKIVVNIIGGARVIRRIQGLELGDNIKLRTAPISLPEMKDIFTITLGTENPIKTSKKEGSTIEPLNFGVRGYAPTTYASLTVSGDETYGIIHNTPRYAHYVLLPIGARVKVVGLDQVIETKITGNRLSV